MGRVYKELGEREHAQEVAKRLKSIYESKKKELNLTQVKLTEQFGGCAQSLISQMLNGEISLSLGKVQLWASILQVDPEAIDPRLARSIKPVITGNVKVPIMFALDQKGVISSPRQRTVDVELPNDIDCAGDGCYAITIESGTHYLYEKGETIVLSMVRPARNNARCGLLMRDGRMYFGFYAGMTDDKKQYKLRDFRSRTTVNQYPVKDVVRVDPIISFHPAPFKEEGA